MKILGRFIKPIAESANQKKIAPADHACATSKKIDTIESEITAEFGNATLFLSSKENSRNTISNLSHTLDEATLLFANGQSNDAKTHLLAATQINGSQQDNQLAWWMLFDLAIVENQPNFFDHLALSYANQFETSPPQWQQLIDDCEDISSQIELPVLNFRGKLSEASLPALHQLELLGLQHHHFQIEFSAITEMDIFGCSAILNVLDTWQKASCDISIRESEAIISRVRQFTQAGRRDSNDAAWRLLIELLRLVNSQEAYENACLEYCMTYEVSPPASPKAPTKSPEQISVFAMPQTVSLPIDKLLLRTSEYALQATAVVLDCRHLRKIEFSAVTPWLNGLKQLAQGKAVECRHMSFLVGRLIQLMGATSWLHITHRKP